MDSSIRIQTAAYLRLVLQLTVTQNVFLNIRNYFMNKTTKHHGNFE